MSSLAQLALARSQDDLKQSCVAMMDTLKNAVIQGHATRCDGGFRVTVPDSEWSMPTVQFEYVKTWFQKADNIVVSRYARVLGGCDCAPRETCRMCDGTVLNTWCFFLKL